MATSEAAQLPSIDEEGNQGQNIMHHHYHGKRKGRRKKRKSKTVTASHAYGRTGQRRSGGWKGHRRDRGKDRSSSSGK